MTTAGVPNWRAAVADAALTLIVVVLAISSVGILITTDDRFLVLLTMVGLISAVLSRQLRSLPLWARAAGVVVPLTTVCFAILATVGLAPNLNLVFGLAAVVLTALLGWRVAVVFLAIVVAGQLLVGWLVVTDRHVVDPDPVRIDDHRTWVRAALVFLVAALALAVTVRAVVRPVERALAEQTAAAEELARQQAELADAHQLLGVLHRNVARLKETERRHLARELHDEMGQALSALKLRLKLRRGDAAAIEDVLAVVDAMLTRVRALSLDLRPVLLDEAGLVPAVRAYLESHAALATTDLTLVSSGLDERLPAELETAAFEVVAESVTNVVRHAAARRVTVTLSRDEAQLEVRVRDDGVGFDVGARLPDATRVGLLGVANMRERVKGLGGHLALSSTPDAGTEVRVTVPLVVPA